MTRVGQFPSIANCFSSDEDDPLTGLLSESEFKFSNANGMIDDSTARLMDVTARGFEPVLRYCLGQVGNPC